MISREKWQLALLQQFCSVVEFVGSVVGFVGSVVEFVECTLMKALTNLPENRNLIGWKQVCCLPVSYCCWLECHTRNLFSFCFFVSSFLFLVSFSLFLFSSSVILVSLSLFLFFFLLFFLFLLEGLLCLCLLIDNCSLSLLSLEVRWAGLSLLCLSHSVRRLNLALNDCTKLSQ